MAKFLVALWTLWENIYVVWYNPPAKLIGWLSELYMVTATQKGHPCPLFLPMYACQSAVPDQVTRETTAAARGSQPPTQVGIGWMCYTLL